MRRERAAGMLIVLALAATAAPAVAQLTLAGKHNSKAPIDITADNLEVEQDKQIATFRGSVVATQEEVKLRADTLIVHYRQKGEIPQSAAKPAGTKTAAAAGASSDPFTSGAISHIDAIGHVVVTAPNQTGEGDSGFYDVDKQMIELDGSHVVLTQCQNVLEGKRAVMHLDTGESTLDTAPGQRVHGLFVPQQKGPNQNQASACPPPAVAGASR